jgi:hypothetical protein
VNKKKDKDIFSDLSDILGIDIYKIVVNKDEEEINRLKRKLLKIKGIFNFCINFLKNLYK